MVQGGGGRRGQHYIIPIFLVFELFNTYTQIEREIEDGLSKLSRCATRVTWRIEFSITSGWTNLPLIYHCPGVT